MKFCKISLIVWIDNLICWIPIFVVPVSIIKLSYDLIFHCSRNTILLKLLDGYRKPTDVEMSLTKACWKEKPDRKLATDAESLGNQRVNQNVWPHRSYHDNEFKSQWISRYPFIYENEWNHGFFLKYIWRRMFCPVKYCTFSVRLTR
jgi:hypothetical protein